MRTATLPARRPIAERPRIPTEYGMPESPEGLMAWEHVDERLREAKVYWVGTASADGRPAVRPVDGLWVDGALYLGGSPETLWVRNVQANPRLSIHLDDGQDVAILEGAAEALPHGVEPELAQRLAAESNRKYPQYGVTADEYIGRLAGFRLRPDVALAWSDFPRDLTRFRFG